MSLVEVHVTVTDRDGRPITGLQAGDFQVTEDGTPQRVSTFATGDVPLSILIALDRSFSMRGDPLGHAKRGAAAFIKALRPEDEVMIVTVGSEVETITPPMPATAAVNTRWEAIDAWGTTPLYDAALKSLDAIQRRRGRRALLLISDGIDRDSHTTATELIDGARRSDVLVYPVALSRARPPVFAELAAVTGGRSLHVSDPRELDVLLGAIARELGQQYLLGYVPSREASTQPAWHSIDVAVNRPAAHIRARDGYYGR